MNRLLVIAAVSALALGLPAFGQSAQEGRLSFSVISYRDGLSNTSVSSIARDSRGFMWFGTQNGLNRYDGKDFKLYENEPFDENSLSQNLIQTLSMDRDDVLWIGTYGGLNRFDIATERFTVYRNSPDDPTSISGDLVIAIRRDSRGRLWVGTSNGLNLMDEAKGTFKRYRHDPKDPGSLPDDMVRAVFCDSAGRVWIGTAGGGFARYDDETDSFENFAHRAGDPLSLPLDSAGAVMSIIQAPMGKLWLGCWGSEKARGGLCLFDPAKGSFRTTRLPDDRIYVLEELERGKIYAGTWGGGLYGVDAATGAIDSYRHDATSESLPNDVVYSMLLDPAGIVWIGTNGGGIAKISAASGDSKAYISDPKDPGSLPMGKINSVLVDSAGALWAGVYNGGVNRYDPATDSWKRYVHRAGDPGSLPNDIVNAIYEDSRSRLWVGTNGGLSLMDRATGRFTTFLPKKGEPSALGSSLINAILDAGNGRLWIGTIDSGLELFDPESGRSEHYVNAPADDSSLSDNLVYCLSYDPKGDLWVGTNKGLNRMEGKAFRRYLYDPANREGISSNSIMALLHDSRGDLLIGSKGGGFMRYLAGSDSFVSATKRDGLPGNNVYGVLEGKDGLVWIITQNGVATYDPVDKVIQRVSALNNLNDNSLTAGCAAGRDGTIYFSSIGALFAYNPGLKEQEASKPPVYVTRISAANAEKLVSPISSDSRPIRLRYWENSVEFRFAALDYADPGTNQFAFKLQGFDKDWTYSGSGNTAKYTNLPGGSYVLRVKASNNHGVWNEEGAAIRIRVETPFWLSYWAYAFYLVVVVMAGYLLATMRDRAALKKKVLELSSTKSALESANAKLEELSCADALTGLANRRKLDIELATAWAYSIRAAMPISGLLIDIDHFKKYNDVYGHQAGDECLRRVTAAMCSKLERDTDSIARYGGDEFFLFLPSTEAHGAMVIAERILKAVADLRIPTSDSAPEGYITLSIGCATLYPIPGDKSESLIAKADESLYRAKEAGRNRVSL